MIQIRKNHGIIESHDLEGNLLKSGAAGIDDTDVIMNNDFRLSKGQRPLRLADTIEAPAGPVLVTGNFISGEGGKSQYNLASGATVVERDNVTNGRKAQ